MFSGAYLSDNVTSSKVLMYSWESAFFPFPLYSVLEPLLVFIAVPAGDFHPLLVITVVGNKSQEKSNIDTGTVSEEESSPGDSYSPITV